MKCQFCRKEFSQHVIYLHQERCLKNPKNIVVEEEEKNEDILESKVDALEVFNQLTELDPEIPEEEIPEEEIPEEEIPEEKKETKKKSKKKR